MTCCVISTGIRKTNSHVTRSGRVTKESRLSRVSHTHPLHPRTRKDQDFLQFSNWIFQQMAMLPDMLPLTTLSGWFTGLCPLAVLYVTWLWLALSSRLIGTKRLKHSKRSSFVCGAIVVSRCTGSNVSAPTCTKRWIVRLTKKVSSHEGDGGSWIMNCKWTI